MNNRDKRRGALALLATVSALGASLGIGLAGPATGAPAPQTRDQAASPGTEMSNGAAQGGQIRGSVTQKGRAGSHFQKLQSDRSGNRYQKIEMTRSGATKGVSGGPPAQAIVPPRQGHAINSKGTGGVRLASPPIGDVNGDGTPEAKVRRMNAELYVEKRPLHTDPAPQQANKGKVKDVQSDGLGRAASGSPGPKTSPAHPAAKRQHTDITISK